MSRNESVHGLAAPQPAVQFDDTSDECKERMRQLANVVIEMFQELRRSELAVPVVLLEAA